MTNPEPPPVLLERRGPVAIVTLNRPQRMNAMGMEMSIALREAVERLEEDPTAAAMVITGAGRGFCSGMDLTTTSTVKERIRASRYNWPRPRPELGLPTIFRNANVAIIAAINGAAAGAGMSLALAADIRIMSDQGRLMPTFLKRGIMPDMGLPHMLTKMLGAQRALELLWQAEPIGPEQALALGLVTRVVPHDRLVDEAVEMGEKLSKGPAVAMAFTKRAVYLAETGELEKDLEWNSLAQRLCLTTEDAQEGARAFLEKRQPVFKGR